MSARRPAGASSVPAFDRLLTLGLLVANAVTWIYAAALPAGLIG